MYKLQEKEQLFFTNNDKAIPAIGVDVDCEKTTIYKASGIIKEYLPSEVSICHLDDENDYATTILNSVFSIVDFHQKLSKCGILDGEDFL